MSVILSLLVILFSIWLVATKFKIFLAGHQIPGPLAFPLVGNIQIALKLKPSYVFVVFTKLRETYRCTFRLWLGPMLWVFLHTPEETKDALNNSTLVKPDTFKQLDVLIGKGLLISEGEQWEVHRKALGPAFHPSLLNSFLPRINKHVDILIQKLKILNGESFEVSDLIFPCILDMVIDTSMGRMINSQKDPKSIYTHAFHKTSELLFKRMMNPLLAFDFIFKHTSTWKSLKENLKIINDLMDSVIKERNEQLCESASDILLDEERVKKHKTLLDILLTIKINEKLLRCKEIRDEVNTFVFAGVDTTTAAMSFVLYALAKYSEEQEKLYNELLAFNLESPDSTFSNNDMNNLEYLDMFLKECLRLYTVVPATGRQTTTLTKIGNRTYPAGVTLWINMYGLAHDAEFFNDPYSFKPERFLKADHINLPLFCYIPFSGGPHVCIGKRYALLMMKSLTIRILQTFQLHLTKPNEDLVLMAQMVLKARDGIHITLEERKK